MVNADRLATHPHNIQDGKADAARGAFPLGPQKTVMGELDPNYQGLLFLDICLEQPELQSIMGDQVPQEVQAKILLAVRQTHVNNLEKLRAWDSKVRTLY